MMVLHQQQRSGGAGDAVTMSKRTTDKSVPRMIALVTTQQWLWKIVLFKRIVIAVFQQHFMPQAPLVGGIEVWVSRTPRQDIIKEFLAAVSADRRLLDPLRCKNSAERFGHVDAPGTSSARHTELVLFFGHLNML